MRAPYPGLRPFERHESDLFFGREEQVDQLLDRLEESHFLAVLGLSGSGKSSLVKAGLLPALEGGDLAGTGARWQVASLRPGDRPIHRLAKSLREETAWGAEAGEEVAELEEKLHRGPQALNWLLGIRPPAAGHRLLILVDQFEELFRYPDRSEAEAFVALLLAAAKQSDTYVVITLRSEFLGRCSAYPDLPEAINAGLFLTPALTPEQMADAIQLPIRLPEFAGAENPGEVEPALVRELLRQARGIDDPLPLLQHALLRLWETDDGDRVLTLDEYRALGGLRQALDDHLEEAFAELDAEGRRIAEVLFRALTEAGDGERDTRRPTPLNEVAALAGVDPAALETAAAPFRKPGRSFLMPPADQSLEAETTLDITHEALIRQWTRLKGWTADEGEQADLYRRLAQAAQRHEEEKEALWIDPALQIALDWRQESAPTARWAERYGGDFERAMAFLDASQAAREARRREEETRKKRELQRARRTALFALLGLLIAIGLALWANGERHRAVEAEQQSEASEQARTRALFDSALTHAALLARVDDPMEGRRVLRETVSLDADIPAERRHARNLLAGYLDLLGGEAEKIYQGAGAQLIDLALSPDGRTLAAAGEYGTLVLFDAESGELRKRLEGHDPKAGSDGAVRAVRFNRDGSRLYSAGDDGRILRWAMPAGERVGEAWEAPAEIFAIALSPDEKILASGNRDGKTTTLWSTTDGKVLYTLQGVTSVTSDGNSLTFTPDGRLVSGGYQGDVGIWTLPTEGEPKEQVLPRIHTDQVNAVAVDPAGQWLATGGADRRIVLWRLTAGGARPVRLLQGHTNRVMGLRFLPGERLLSASHDNTMRLWDLAGGATLRIFQGHTAGLWSIALDEEHDRVYTAANDATLRRWPLATPNQWRWSLPGEPASAAIDPVGRLVSVGFRDGSLRLYPLPGDGRANEQEGPLPVVEIADAHGRGGIARIAFSPDGHLIATAGMDGKAKLWGVERTPDGPTLTLRHDFTDHHDSVHAVAFSPDGRTLATAGYDGKVGLYDVESGEGAPYEAHDGKVGSVSFDGTGTKLLTAGIRDRRLRLWDIGQSPPSPATPPIEMNDTILWATLRPDAHQLAAVGRESVVTLHDLGPEPTPPHRLVGHEQTVFRAEYTPDGTQLATVGGDMTLRLWDLGNDKPLFTLRLPTEFKSPSPLWDLALRCLPADATLQGQPLPDAGHCWFAVPLTMGRLALYRLPYEDPPPSLRTTDGG